LAAFAGFFAAAFFFAVFGGSDRAWAKALSRQERSAAG
jgi:hypothetical protein